MCGCDSFGLGLQIGCCFQLPSAFETIWRHNKCVANVRAAVGLMRIWKCSAYAYLYL